LGDLGVDGTILKGFKIPRGQVCELQRYNHVYTETESWKEELGLPIGF